MAFFSILCNSEGGAVSLMVSLVKPCPTGNVVIPAKAGIQCCQVLDSGRRLHNHIKTTILSFPLVAEPVEAGGNPVISKLSGCRPLDFARAGLRRHDE
jgi:hypothetical protein